MAYAITETTAAARHVFKSFPSFSEAVDFAKANFPIVDFEEDAESSTADFITKFGTVYAIDWVKAA